MYGSRGTVVSPSGPLTTRDVEDGVRVTLGGIGMGCFPMFDMNPQTRAELLKCRRVFMVKSTRRRSLNTRATLCLPPLGNNSGDNELDTGNLFSASSLLISALSAYANPSLATAQYKHEHQLEVPSTRTTIIGWKAQRKSTSIPSPSTTAMGRCLLSTERTTPYSRNWVTGANSNESSRYVFNDAPIFSHNANKVQPLAP